MERLKSPGSQIAAFFLVSHGLTWLFWIPLALFKIPVQTSPGFFIFYLGGLGPPVAVLLFLFFARGKEYRREYWNRIYDIRRIPWLWLAVIILLLPLVRVTAISSITLFRGDPLALNVVVDAEFIARFTPFYILLMFAPPLAEEVAWRGYGLDVLQSRHTAVTASVMLGVLWWGWHLPLFFMADTYQAGLGVLTPLFWDFTIAIFAKTFIYTWIFINTNRSILGAIIFHFMNNFAGELLTANLTMRAVTTGFYLVLALFAVISLQKDPRACPKPF